MISSSETLFPYSLWSFRKIVDIQIRRVVQGETNMKLGSTSAKTFFYTCAILYQLHLPFSSAGDQCPAQEKLNPCVCFQDSEMKGPFTTTTTTLPMEITRPRRSVVNSPSQNRNADVEPRFAETTLTAYPSPPPNETCCTVVTCSAPRSLLIMQDSIINALSRKWVDRLILSNLPPQKEHTLVRLPAGFLKTLRVKHFEVKDTILSGDFIHYGNPFEGQEQSMVWFTAQNCYLSGSLSYDTVGTVNTKGLNYMPKIEGVDFSKNHLVYVAATGFRHPPTNLSSVALSFNSIQTIESGTFHHIPYLKRLDLSHNLLEIIARNILAAPARNLQYIDLSWNQLKVLPNDFFVNMPALKSVILSNNFLTSMPNQPWAAIWRQLSFVDITNNFILCDCSLTWLLPILSPPGAKSSPTPTPVPLAGQILLGSCSYFKPNSDSTLHQLTNITRASLNC